MRPNGFAAGSTRPCRPKTRSRGSMEMPRSTTRQQTQEQDTQVDVLPPPDDDVDPAPHDATRRPDDEGPAVAPPRGQDRPEPPQPEDRLAEITQLYRAARDKAKATPVDSDTEGDDGADDAQGKV